MALKESVVTGDIKKVFSALEKLGWEDLGSMGNYWMAVLRLDENAECIKDRRGNFWIIIYKFKKSGTGWEPSLSYESLSSEKEIKRSKAAPPSPIIKRVEGDLRKAVEAAEEGYQLNEATETKDIGFKEIYERLRRKPHSLRDLETELGLNQATILQHLSKIREIGKERGRFVLLESREGAVKKYRISEEI